MIKYALICQNQHIFDAWFRNSAAFDEQRQGGDLACPVCNNQQIEKALMAPAIIRKTTTKSPAKQAAKQTAKSDDKTPQKSAETDQNPPKSPEKSENIDNIVQMVNGLHDYVAKHFDYVGADFAEEARAMHYGEKETRNIYGESTAEEALDLREEGVAATPLPIVPAKYKN